MMQHVYQRFRGGCMMLLNREGNEVVFLGTAFLVHEEGYLITAAHLLHSHKDLMVEPFTMSAEEFVPLSFETARPISVSVVQTNQDRDIALLKFPEKIDISAPDHILGRSDEVLVGSNLACIGYPFGNQGLNNQVILQTVLASKVLSQNGTKLIIFDTMVHNGSRGGPLINLQDGRVIGVISGAFHPSYLTKEISKSDSSFGPTNLSLAVAIEYGQELLESEGLEIT